MTYDSDILNFVPEDTDPLRANTSPAAAETSQKKIMVLVDRTVPWCRKPARDSFWPQVLDGRNYETISISDSKEKSRNEIERPDAVRIESANVVIVNWDVANGDYMCGSDDVLLYFQARRDRRGALLRAGGTLFCEFQAGSGCLHQGAYDALFGTGEVQVQEANSEDEKRRWHGAQVDVLDTYPHPITEGLTRPLESHHVDNGERIFNFVRDEGYKNLRGYKDKESQLWRGWFGSWKKGWVPLLVARLASDADAKVDPFMPRAVLLAKCESGGLLLASTMWIAGSRCQKLVDNIMDADLNKIAKVHKRILWNRRIGDAAWALPFFFIVAAAIRVLNWLVKLAWSDLTAHLPNWIPDFTLIEDMGFIWLTILAIRAYTTLVCDRPFGVGTVRSVVHGSWNFIKETL